MGQFEKSRRQPYIPALNGDYLTILGLARSLNAEPADFKRSDAVERAVGRYAI